MTKRITLALVALLACLPHAWCIDIDKAQQAVNRLANDNCLRHASLGVAITELESGNMVASYQPDMMCITASTMKAVTSAAALELLGTNFVWTTQVLLRGNTSDDGAFTGDIVVKGSGDPTLGSSHFDDNPSIVSQIVQALKDKGITSIEGRIVTDGSAIPYPPFFGGWDIDHLASDYGMGIFGINYKDNTVHIAISGSTPRAHLVPDVPGVKIIDKLTRGNSQDVDLFLDYGTPAFVLSGVWAGKRVYRETANPNPAALLQSELESTIKRAGISYIHDDETETSQMPSEVLVDHKSPRLPQCSSRCCTAATT